MRVVGSGSSKPADPAVTIVKPGHYKLLSGVCDRADYLPTDLPNLNQWFHTLEVNPGDVIYVGTLNTDIVKVQTRQKTAKAITNFLLMQDFDGRNDTEYPVYYFTEDKGKVQAYLEGHIPEIAEKLIARSPYQVLSPEAMEAAYRNAYALDEEGHMPTDEEAELKLKAEMETAVRISLDKYKADVEQRLKSIVEEREVEAQIYQGT